MLHYIYIGLPPLHETTSRQWFYCAASLLTYCTGSLSELLTPHGDRTESSFSESKSKFFNQIACCDILAAFSSSDPPLDTRLNCSFTAFSSQFNSNPNTFWQMKTILHIYATVVQPWFWFSFCVFQLWRATLHLPAPPHKLCSPLPWSLSNRLQRLSHCCKIEFPCNQTATAAAAAAPAAAATLRRREGRKSLNKARWRARKKKNQLGPKQLEGKLNQSVVKTKQYVFSFS